MRIQRQNVYTAIPKKALADENLSLQAKGYYACLMSDIGVEDENSFNELLENGYIELRNNEYVLLVTPKTRKSKDTVDVDNPFIVEPSKKLKTKKKKPLPDIILDCVNEYTKDDGERKQLMRYFNLRLNPPETSKFYEHKLIGKQHVLNILKSLDSCPTKIESIIQSIDKEWSMFYPYHSNNYKKSRDNISSSSYSKEELLDITSNKETF